MCDVCKREGVGGQEREGRKGRERNLCRSRHKVRKVERRGVYKGWELVVTDLKHDHCGSGSAREMTESL
jgi:hypothetical protein